MANTHDRRALGSASVTGIQPELWVDQAPAAVEFYKTGFGAVVLHHVGEGNDIVVQLAVGDAAFWVTASSPDMKRFSPKSIGGATGRTLLIVDDPSAVLQQAVSAGAREVGAVSDEHGWRLGRIVDPFGHEWEIGRPLGEWPPGEGSAG
jgi:PhnB protein